MKLPLLPCLWYKSSDVFPMAAPRLLLGEAGLFSNQHDVVLVHRRVNLLLSMCTQHTPFLSLFLAHMLSPPAIARRTHSLSNRAGVLAGFCNRNEHLDFNGGMTWRRSYPVVTF